MVLGRYGVPLPRGSSAGSQTEMLRQPGWGRAKMTSPFSDVEKSLLSPKNHQDRPPTPRSAWFPVRWLCKPFLVSGSFFPPNRDLKPSKARNMSSKQRHQEAPWASGPGEFPEPLAGGFVRLPLRLVNWIDEWEITRSHSNLLLLLKSSPSTASFSSHPFLLIYWLKP